MTSPETQQNKPVMYWQWNTYVDSKLGLLRYGGRFRFSVFYHMSVLVVPEEGDISNSVKTQVINKTFLVC
jgi:hypothetical protein